MHIPCRFKEEESEEGIFETFPNIQEKEVVGECLEFVKEDVLETTIPEEVRFYDTGQVTTLTIKLAKCNSPSISPWCSKDVLPKTFEVVFVLEFLLDHTGKPPPRISISFYTNMLLMIQAPTLEFKPLLDHFNYHLPFKEKERYRPARKRFLGGNPCIQIKKTKECLHNQICVLKPYSLLFLLCIFIVFVRCVVCLLMCVSLFETLRTMFDSSMGGVNKLFLHDFRGFYAPITYNVVSHCFYVFLVCFEAF